MSKSNVSRAVLGAFVLFCIPAMAAGPAALADPTIKISITGGRQIDSFHYTLETGRLVTVDLETTPGDLILVMAAPLTAAGEIDESQAFQLLLLRDAPLGTASASMSVPKELAHLSFALGAINLSPKSGWGNPMIVQIDVVEHDPGLVEAPFAGIEE